MATPRQPESPPRDLLPESKRLWKDTIEHLRDQDTWQVSDVPALERYVRAMERARVARESLAGKDGRPVLTAVGSQGQLVQHPNVKTAREAERDANDYAQQLLLTPAARRRAQVEAKGSGGGKFGGVFS